MMFKRLLLLVFLVLALVTPTAVAQDTTTVTTAKDPNLGTILTDPAGMTLYIFLNDVPDSGESACYNQCEEAWPAFTSEEPLTLPTDVPGELGLLTRTDGTTQVTYNEWPLYYWASDIKPGDVTGQSIGEVWFVAVPTEDDATPGADLPTASPMASPAAMTNTTMLTMEDPRLGTILTDAQGMALYIFLKDEPGSGDSACYDQCEENWPVFSAEEPLTLPEGVPGDLGTIDRTDGTMQVTYNGWPLYYWASDTKPGDVTGQNIGEVWFVAAPTEGDATPGADVPTASPMASPAAMANTSLLTMEDPGLGTIFTDAQGMALYIFLKDEPGSGDSTCYDQCEENWPVFSAEEPLTLPEGVPGALGTIERTDGTMQVTYNGWPLYYWVQDQSPGDVTGQNVGEVWFVAIPAVSEEIPGADAPEM